MDAERGWALPGSRRARRSRLYSTAARIGARYAWSALAGDDLERAHRRGARDLYRTAVELRGAFLKLGQFVSARPDLLPEAYVDQLSKLQDRVPPAPASVISRVIADDVASLDDLFASFDHRVASAASLAQVHRAVRHDGRAVAVKVQYPHVADIVPDEVREMRRILGLVSRVMDHVDLDTIARVLERSVRAELDYSNEADNIERFAVNFAAQPDVVVPAVHRDLSRGRVLVMDWVEGTNLAQALAAADHDLADRAARLLVDAYMKQILVDGFVHADPHPGNFLLQDGPRIGFVDFGACAQLGDETRTALRAAYAAALHQDVGALADALDALGFRTRSGDLTGLAGWASLFNFHDVGTDREAAWKQLISAARSDPLVKLPDELILVGRVLIVQTGLVARIGPSWRLDEIVERHLAAG